MTRKHQRSRKMRRVFVKTQKSKVGVVYKKRKPSKAVCSVCKKPLHGVLRERPYKVRGLAKTKRRPERPYGGVLCSRCTRRLLISEVRSKK